MPNNYGPNLVPGQVRTRLNQINCQNPNVLAQPGSKPFLLMFEEQAVSLAEADPVTGATERSLGATRQLSLSYAPGKTFDLRNPETDALLGTTALHEQFFVMFYSICRQAQTDADAELAARIAAEAVAVAKAAADAAKAAALAPPAG